MHIRFAERKDLPSILGIYNQGIEDRIATLELDQKDMNYITNWFEERSDRYRVFVAEIDGNISGWASINPYSHRCTYAGVGDLSVYIHRDWRGKKIGQALLFELEAFAKENGFHKIVLFTFPFNASGQGLYHKMGFREVGVFKNQGKLEDTFVDVMAMEKSL
jgi:L-amino acid N-acyltransferase YncA